MSIPASAADVVDLSLPNLRADVSYAIAIRARSQTGVVSTVPAVATWLVLAAAPGVDVLARPDAVSGSSSPRFTFAARWGDVPNSVAAVVAVANVSFETLVLGSPDLGGWHVPPLCDWERSESSTQRDCVAADCNGTSCDYVLQLQLAKGHTQPYTLQVRAWVAAVGAGCGVLV